METLKEKLEAIRAELGRSRVRVADLELHIRDLLSCVQANGGRGGGGQVNPMFFSIKSVDDYAKVATKARDALEARSDFQVSPLARSGP